MSQGFSQKRPLSSLTAEECHALYEAAFGPIPAHTVRAQHHGNGDYLLLHDRVFYLAIYRDGSVLASRRAFGSQYNDLCASFSMHLLMGQITKLDVEFGLLQAADQPTGSPSAPVEQ